MITVGSVVSFEMKQTGDRARSMLVLSHLILWMCEFMKFLVSFVCFREHRTWCMWCERKKTVSLWGRFEILLGLFASGAKLISTTMPSGDSNLELDRQ